MKPKCEEFCQDASGVYWRRAVITYKVTIYYFAGLVAAVYKRTLHVVNKWCFKRINKFSKKRIPNLLFKAFQILMFRIEKEAYPGVLF